MIIAIKDKDQVYLVFDQREWMLIGLIKEDYMLYGNLPYWKPEGTENMLVTATSNLRARDVLRYNVKFSEPLSLKYIQFYIASEIRKTLIEFNCIEDKEEEPFEHVIIASKNELYVIDRYFFAEKIQDVIVFGDYSKIIHEVLVNQLQSDMKIEDRIIEAIKLYNLYAITHIQSVFIINTSEMILKKLEVN